MSNVGTAALAVIGTIIGGVVVYVLGRMIERAFIEPLNDYRQLVVEVAGALALHADYWGNTGAWDALTVIYSQGTPDEPWRNELSKATGAASRDLRAKSAQLGAHALTIPWYRLWSLLRFLPKRGDVLLASSELMGISNRTPARQDEAAQANTEAYRHVQALLRMATKP